MRSFKNCISNTNGFICDSLSYLNSISRGQSILVTLKCILCLPSPHITYSKTYHATGAALLYIYAFQSTPLMPCHALKMATFISKYVCDLPTPLTSLFLFNFIKCLIYVTYILNKRNPLFCGGQYNISFIFHYSLEYFAAHKRRGYNFADGIPPSFIHIPMPMGYF